LAETATRLAKEEDLDAVAALFDAYRQFYGRERDLHGATGFIAERMGRGESVIIVAEEAGEVVGFAQLYPSFTSVGMDRIMILNDLFVAPEARGTGAGRALLDASADWARRVGAARLTLTTQKTNERAQSVYEANGWARDTEFLTYNLRLSA
jgi:GNAT superfamily N-acetyltransferase